MRRCVTLLRGGSPVGFMPYTPIDTNPVVFLDISAAEKVLGRVVIELFADTAPKTAENFRSLCTGERGHSRWVWKRGSKSRLYLKGVPFHRIIPNFVIQGGDVLYGDGRGNESVFGYRFLDESFEGKCGKHLEGTIAMASSGPNQNGSQFFVNLRRSPQLDGKFVVFGQIIDGWDVFSKMSTYGSRCGVPLDKVWISDCGQSGGLHHSEVNELDTTIAPSTLPGQEVLDWLRPR